MIGPRKPIPDEPKNRINTMGRHPDDHHARQELLLDREGNDRGIEKTERHSPFVDHRRKGIIRVLRQFRKVSGFGKEAPARWCCKHRRTQFGELRYRSLRRKGDLRTPRSLEIFYTKQVDSG